MPSIFRRGRTFYTRTGRTTSPVYPGTRIPVTGLAPSSEEMPIPIWHAPEPMNRPRVSGGPFNRPGSVPPQMVDPDIGRPPGTEPFPSEERPSRWQSDAEFVRPRDSLAFRKDYDDPLPEFSPRIGDAELLEKSDRSSNALQIDLMATFFERQVPHRLREGLDNVLDDIGKYATEVAREMVLEQEGVSMGIWPPLAEETIARKLTSLLLYESGEMVDSIHYEVDRTLKTVTLTADAEEIYYSELGTAHEPARPLLAPAMEIATQQLPAELGNAIDVAFDPKWKGGGRTLSHHFDPFPRIMDMAALAVGAIDAGETPPSRLPFNIPELPNRVIGGRKNWAWNPQSKGTTQIVSSRKGNFFPLGLGIMGKPTWRP